MLLIALIRGHVLWVELSYAKLLTGGTLPLSATLATKDVFDAFHVSTPQKKL